MSLNQQSPLCAIQHVYVVGV